MTGRRTIRRQQRGVGTLAVTMLLLFTMTLIALYANRSLLFEQKTSANQYRSTRAFEMAEAGIEWATARLNDPRAVDSRCVAAASGPSFREKYLPHDQAFRLMPVTTAKPACRASGGSLDCACPSPGEATSLEGPNHDSFSIAFAGVPGDPDSVQVTASGDNTDATARISVVLKLKPLIRAMPAAALTAGGAVNLDGSVALSNSDPASHGALVHAGLAVATASSVSLTTLPGSPSINALISNDTTLTSETVFTALFGMTPDQYPAAAPVHRISADSPAARAAALRAAYALGYGAFHVDGELQFDASPVGSADRPVLIVSAFPISCSEPCDIHGLIYTDGAARDATALAHIRVNGALATRGDHNQAAGEIAYQAATLRTLRHRTSMLVRLPGSWCDF